MTEVNSFLINPKKEVHDGTITSHEICYDYRRMKAKKDTAGNDYEPHFFLDNWMS